MSNTYIFKVRIYDIDTEQEYNERGYLVADNYRDACGQILGYYEEDSIITMEVEYLSDKSLIFIPTHVNMKQINTVNMEM